MMTASRIPTEPTSADSVEPPTERDLAKPSSPPRTVGKIGADANAKPNAQDDDEDEWRHEPIAPVDEPNPLRSLGKAIGDTVTGSDRDAPAPLKR